MYNVLNKLLEYIYILHNEKYYIVHFLAYI